MVHILNMNVLDRVSDIHPCDGIERPVTSSKEHTDDSITARLNQIFVAITVMNCTFASSDRLAI